MKTHLNTLYVTTQGTYLALRGQAVVVRHEKKTLAHLPLHNLEAIVCFGRIGCSPLLLGACGEKGVTVSMLTERGRFLAAVRGFTTGNVLLRRQQYRLADDPTASAAVARNIVAAKLANSRLVLLRALRDANEDDPRAGPLRASAARIAALLIDLPALASIDEIRGLEGNAAVAYFEAFNALQTNAPKKEGFLFERRSRRPPLDPINALLSFLYTLLMLDVRSACESVGLDPAVGYLHEDRPGRPGLALDLMEEFRAFLADRVALSLINRRQISPDGFRVLEGGGVEMDDPTRKAVLVAWQQRKRETLTHPFLGESTTVGMLVHLQALLLARWLRGDLDAYPPFIWKG